jgi:outer membrane protein OmpA-like peptidoglycan-associated protein/tetratricopeptide (TPR) repeat protein
MMRQVLLVFLLTFVACLQVQGQAYSIIDKRAIGYYEEGESFLSRKQFGEAADKFRDAYQRSKDFYEAYIRHAQTLLTTGRSEEALEVVRLAENRLAIKDSDLFRGRLAWLKGQVLVEMGHFEEALEAVEQSTPYLTEEFTASDSYRENMQQFRMIEEGIRNPLSLNKEKLPAPLNRFQLQYFPVLTADGKRIFFTKRDGMSARDHEDIFFSNRDEGDWTVPEPISLSINTRYNEGTCTISADGRLLIFTSCDTPDSFGSCDLYLTERVNGSWQKPRNMGRNVNSRFWDSQPSLSADGRMLFFSSNRPEGKGGNDIWFSKRDETGQWSPAENLGQPVNTSGDEVSPFVFFNNTVLFFASDGHSGFGKKDLFISRYTSRGFGAPENLGYPINDQKDQLALFITAQKDYAYYTENSYHQGKADSSFLYRFDFPEEIDLGENLVVTEGRVLNEQTGEPVEAVLSLVNLENDSTLYTFRSEGEAGTFTMIYPDKSFSGLYVEKQGYMPRIFNVDRDNLKNQKNLEIYLEPISSGNRFVFENVFFDFDDTRLKSASISSLKRLVAFLETHPAISITIAGHTDNVGSDAYNLTLSTQRALEVKEFLVESGVAESRIDTRGMGASDPLVSNETEENRAFNRRIEVIIR